MKIKKLKLQNGYKRFHDLTIDLGETPKRIVALVGPNGCGKSSVLDGILFMTNAYRKIGDKEPKDHNYHSMTNNPGYQYNNIDIEFDIGSYREVFNGLTATGKESTMVSFRSPYRYNSSLKVTQEIAVPELRLNGYGASSASDLDEKMEMNYRRLNNKFTSYMYETNSRPNDAIQHIIGELNQSIGRCLALEVTSLGRIQAGQGTLYFKKADHPNQFEFNVLSSGEKEVVDILLDLYLRKDDYSNTIFLLDEPELHINTAIQKKLLIEINNLIGPECQLWLSTHSIGFLRALQEEFAEECQVIQFTEEMALASTTHIIHPTEMTSSKWREIFGIALDDLVHLVSPRRIIYCEGRDLPGPGGRERGFDAIVYNTIFSKQHHDTLFVSSGGNTELDQRSSIAIAIISKALPTVEILILKDRDMASGNQTTEQDRQQYLASHDPSHRVLKRWEIENYLFDKEVLRIHCSENQLQFNEDDYDAFVSNINDEHVKDYSGNFKSFCGIDQNDNTEVFKKNLAKCIRPGMAVYIELEYCIFNRG